MAADLVINDDRVFGDLGQSLVERGQKHSIRAFTAGAGDWVIGGGKPSFRHPRRDPKAAGVVVVPFHVKPGFCKDIQKVLV